MDIGWDGMRWDENRFLQVDQCGISCRYPDDFLTRSEKHVIATDEYGMGWNENSTGQYQIDTTCTLIIHHSYQNWYDHMCVWDRYQMEWD